jgi:hypothetical protein
MTGEDPDAEPGFEALVLARDVVKLGFLTNC